MAYILFHLLLGVGFTLIGFGRLGLVAMPGAQWLQVCFWVLGAGLVLLSGRAMVRRLGDHKQEVTEERKLALKRRGLLLIGVGLALLVLSFGHEPLGIPMTVTALGQVFFTVVALNFLLMGAVAQMDIDRLREQKRLANGEGMKAVATIKTIKDTGATLNEAPGVRMGLSIALRGGEVIEREFKGYCPRLALAKLEVGGALAIRVSETDDTIMAVDWMEPADAVGVNTPEPS